MYLRKTIIGDLYLASSIIFFFLAFLYIGYDRSGWWMFLATGIVIAFIGMQTKREMAAKEEIDNKKKR